MITKRQVIDFYDKASKEWANLDKISPERLEINSYFLDEILKTKRTILDVGCGGGALSKYYAEKGHDVISIDISQGMIDFCLSYGGTNPSFLVKDIELTSNLGRFDLVMLCDSLEHTLDVSKALRNSFSMVKKKGYIYITIPHPEYRKARGIEGQPVDQIIELKWLKNTISFSHFSIVKDKGYGHDWGDYTTYYGILARRN